MPHQFLDNGGSAGIHLELGPDFASVGDISRDEVDVVYDTSEVILCCGTYVAADTQGKLAFSVRQQDFGCFLFLFVGACGSWM